MTPRERVLAVLDRKPVDRIPVDLWHAPEVAAALRAHFGVGDDVQMWQALGVDKIVWDFPEYVSEDGDRASTLSGTGAVGGGRRNAWGVPLRTVEAGGARYEEFAAPPLANCTLASLDDYPWWPRPERFDCDAAAALAARLSPTYAVIGPWVSLFEIYCQLRGMEQAMVDLVAEPALVDGMLDRIEAIQTEMMKRLFAKAASRLDLVFVSDDIAGQRSLLISPRTWTRHLQPRLRRWCDLAHAHGLRVFYHTDGAARPLLGPILDCGVDVLNPVQHACPGMDLAGLKRDFGERVIFHGGVDNQAVLPRGTVDEVRAEVGRCLRTLGAGREGYVCCSCHNVQAGTPIANIVAMVDAVLESARASAP